MQIKSVRFPAVILTNGENRIMKKTFKDENSSLQMIKWRFAVQRYERMKDLEMHLSRFSSDNYKEWVRENIQELEEKWPQLKKGI